MLPLPTIFFHILVLGLFSYLAVVPSQQWRKERTCYKYPYHLFSSRCTKSLLGISQQGMFSYEHLSWDSSVSPGNVITLFLASPDLTRFDIGLWWDFDLESFHYWLFRLLLLPPSLDPLLSCQLTFPSPSPFSLSVLVFILLTTLFLSSSLCFVSDSSPLFLLFPIFFPVMFSPHCTPPFCLPMFPNPSSLHSSSSFFSHFISYFPPSFAFVSHVS